ncbi:MAG TPA: DUF4383 domain-containing protein [Candidatus Limnocylindria bacterium]|nr:DUF4383 domain-containing protein [Candidatus Limnocylindria bacterium]
MSPTRVVVGIFGVVYLVVGILGFLGNPFVTSTTHPDMPSATGALLGIFPINAIHNVVHLAIGAVLLIGATEVGRAVLAARGVAVVYALVGVLGLIAPDTFGIMPIGGADVFLHLATAAVLFGVTFLEGRDTGYATAR